MLEEDGIPKQYIGVHSYCTSTRLRHVYDVQICTKSTFSVRHGKLKYYSIVQGRTIENMSRAV